MDALQITPVGIVHSSYNNPETIPMQSHTATIEILPAYVQGLLRIEAHSHLWILSWFHKARRDLLRTVPGRVNANAPEYGVFGLRAAGRPNPIGLSLVELIKVEKNILHVRGLDAVDGSPVVDIKPYFEHDIIFSPRAPYIMPQDKKIRYRILFKQAYNHHQEECRDLQLALRMAMVAEDEFGKLNSPELIVSVKGSGCLADTIQGLFRARLANPARFAYLESTKSAVNWTNGTKKLAVSLIRTPTREEMLDLDNTDFLKINRH
ncbi:tRNA (N6-threonylcarbamoyladenosine(37)-N6)-methyltransferase TrmO [Pelotomaculum terephthalicicum JT]|uniref:tRNA (N6-threonylcarbamoyladenosine(37)-N6)-methyltransferase TrmO n=1 Tax=Pelotomaculum TaxID=191373 RepID=UPI0009D0F26A|nr:MULTISPECIES: tRNA (N6-threonylcarbamoyladenosine(37)-N6)-methyltransferase TrmO [Pelotomaculum]MCG9967206.1 tRNA (N6-threonylcarbamoyladenosine(37)-N6)-methyltransferase TrmO [Pelotomaculum terephthalicicum JT]OPX86960.1 MAG: putative tRNA (adenine(37)-N6)-methyltransferase [Pelotomaculum sp. PtaB.Bin117]OPY61551.1 MAG: putative tRNA (adenine(37)-N6)-methyltransferase [Pelotomaculum sp. PtaU1.Bin065]